MNIELVLCILTQTIQFTLFLSFFFLHIFQILQKKTLDKSNAFALSYLRAHHICLQFHIVRDKKETRIHPKDISSKQIQCK